MRIEGVGDNSALLRTAPLCSFYVRTPAEDEGMFHYDSIALANPRGDGHLLTPHPPVVGDHIHLWDVSTDSGGTFEVIARRWLHTSFGATDWPVLDAVPVSGPLMEIVVVASEGVFVNQSLRDEDDE